MLLALSMLATSFCLYWLWRRKFLRRRLLPPGPAGWPVFGNLLQLKPNVWLQFTQWKTQYGPIVYLNLAGQDVVVLNTNSVAADLLEKRGLIYSSRPRLILACGILTQGLFFTFVQYNSIWRRMRRAAHEAMHRIVVKDYFPIQVKESILLLDELQREPENWDEHLRRNVASTVLSMTYNIPTLKSVNDPPMADITEFTQRIVRVAFFQGPIIEYFPILASLPGWMWPWKRHAQIWSEQYTEMFVRLFQNVKDRVNDGDQRSSFVASVLSKQDRLNLSDKQLSWLAASIAAGSETARSSLNGAWQDNLTLLKVAASMSWFLFAIIQHPEIQLKAQMQLDAVVGRSRLPSFDDMKDLPYIHALVRETLRWHPVDPLGMQHMLTEDDWYGGYFIPKNTICIANVWAMNRSEETYGATAGEFNPDRYLDEHGQLVPPNTFDTNKEEGHVAFGFGRRICIGRHLANNSLLINIASMLWMYNIQPVLDHAGRPIIPPESESRDQVLVVRPPWFQVRFSPRFGDSSSVLEHAKDALFL